MHTTGVCLGLSLLAAAALLVPVAPVLAAPESAESSAIVTVNTGSRHLNVRSAPSVTSQWLGSVPDGSRITITCYARGSVFSGGPYGLSTDLWNRLADGGYVTDAMLDTGSNDPVVPPCATESIRPAEPMATRKTVYSNPAEEGSALWGALNNWYFASGKRSYPAVEGAPRDLVASARRAGWTVVGNPRERAVVVMPPGVLGAPASGHVAWVDATHRRPDGIYLRITEMSAPGKVAGSWTGRTVKAVPELSYILLP